MSEVQPEKFPEDEKYPLDAETTPVADQPTPALIFSDSTYEMLRLLVTVLLPGLATFYTGLASVWGFGYVAQVVGTIAAVTTLLGLVLGVARRTYNNSDTKFDGAVRFTDIPEQQRVDMALAFGNIDPKTLMDKKEVVLKVSPPPTS
jgi:hypothetical protein